MDSTFGYQLANDIAEAVHRHEHRDEPYLATVRLATARLGALDLQPDDVHGALLGVEDCARIDLDVPTASRRRAESAVKGSVKRLTGWYLRYLGDQVTLLGLALVRFGTSVALRTDQLEEATGRLSGDLRALTARVDRLEAGPSGR
jgi:hypothetical protein